MTKPDAKFVLELLNLEESAGYCAGDSSKTVRGKGKIKPKKSNGKDLPFTEKS